MTAASVSVRAFALVEIQVEVPLYRPRSTGSILYDEVRQAVQDALGHTGAVVHDITEWKEA